MLAADTPIIRLNFTMRSLIISFLLILMSKTKTKKLIRKHIDHNSNISVLCDSNINNEYKSPVPCGIENYTIQKQKTAHLHSTIGLI